MADIIQGDALLRKVTGTSVGTALTILIGDPNNTTKTGAKDGPLGLIRYGRKTFQVKNTGATAFNAAQLQATAIPDPNNPGLPSPTDADWETIDSTSLATLAAGATKSIQIFSDSRMFWRLLASVAAGTTTADAYVTAGAV